VLARSWARALPHPGTLEKGGQQSPRDAAPAPAAESRGARCLCETGALLRREREQALELGAEVVRVSRLEAGEVPALRRVLRLQPFGDLLEAGMPGDERRATGGSG